MWTTICARIRYILPKFWKFLKSLFSNKKMDCELKRKIMRVDGKLYRFPVITESDNHEEKDIEDENIDVNLNYESDITEIQFSSDSEGKYKHSLYVPRILMKSIAGPKGSNKRKLEEETNTSILLPENKKNNNIVIIGSSGREIVSARHQIDILAKDSRHRVRCTHFMSIPMNDERIMENFNNFKTEVLTSSGKESQGVKENLFQTDKRLHLTLDVLWLFDETEQREATRILNSCKQEVIDPFIARNGSIAIEARGVTCMNNDPTKVHILYAQIVDEEGHLQKLSDEIINYFIEQGLMREKREKVKLHMTVMNTLFASLKERKRKESGKLKRETFDASNIIKVHKDTNFGRIDLSVIHLSQFSTDESGYYKPTAIIVPGASNGDKKS